MGDSGSFFRNCHRVLRVTESQKPPYTRLRDRPEGGSLGILDRSLEPFRQRGWQITRDFEYFDLIPPDSFKKSGK